MPDLGFVKPGSTVYAEFDSFGTNGASITLTGLAASDVEIYKDGSVTQRASDAGYTLLDTDGIDFDSVTGIHGLSISLADNTTAGFYAAGSHYRVVVSSVTVDSQTVSFTACTFRIGHSEAILNTTIAVLNSQTSFTLTAGPAEDDALNGMWLVIHDVASAVQQAAGIVSDYTGATKTVTLAAAPTFTIAATDNVSVMGPMPLQPTTTGNKLDVTTTGAGGIDWGNVENQGTAVDLFDTNVNTVSAAVTVQGIDAGVITANSIAAAAFTAAKFGGAFITSSSIDSNAIIAAHIASNAITADKIASDAITAAKIATGAIDADAIAADAVTEIQSGLATAAALDTVDNFLDTEIAAIKSDTAAILDDTGTSGVLLANTTHTLTKLVVSNASGNAVEFTSTGSNGHGVQITGHGTGHGLYTIGGATGHGSAFQGGATSGDGLLCVAVNGHGGRFIAGTSGVGIWGIGLGAGAGMRLDGGATGAGMRVIAGTTSGDGILVT
jgi:hypothetical protein